MDVGLPEYLTAANSLGLLLLAWAQHQPINMPPLCGSWLGSGQETWWLSSKHREDINTVFSWTSKQLEHLLWHSVQRTPHSFGYIPLHWVQRFLFNYLHGFYEPLQPNFQLGCLPAWDMGVRIDWYRVTYDYSLSLSPRSFAQSIPGKKNNSLKGCLILQRPIGVISKNGS